MSSISAPSPRRARSAQLSPSWTIWPRLGITAIQIMPLAEFYGKFNWGYDGAMWFAPEIQVMDGPKTSRPWWTRPISASIMVFLDVVYNHFGPHGNYLPAIAPIFTKRHMTVPGAMPSITTGRVRPWCASWSSKVRSTG